MRGLPSGKVSRSDEKVMGELKQQNQLFSHGSKPAFPPFDRGAKYSTAAGGGKRKNILAQLSQILRLANSIAKIWLTARVSGASALDR